MGEYVDIVEAARIIGVSVNTLRRWRRLNKGPVSFTVAGRVMYDTHDIHSWWADQRYQTRRGGM
ncbi:Helix-turn-helix domain [Mycobacteroides abscessus subsp. massiliense]|uniref:helix-turn-helix domain-containing protein n=1 Tax=Mycobacteroides abscessus TaxID=36809 RepID=UPI0009A81E03|nr:Helix-turn-helix domain [Mycobacteroides abscessus subsp. massiliense]SKL00675.1 Helix-turn-helix domain [Mycobacteroides abscessus subsp. massiliense]SKM11165.1 Helix-turn-helix domain [Mycobacteroides abscessus subsp. massiliense]